MKRDEVDGCNHEWHLQHTRTVLLVGRNQFRSSTNASGRNAKTWIVRCRTHCRFGFREPKADIGLRPYRASLLSPKSLSTMLARAAADVFEAAYSLLIFLGLSRCLISQLDVTSLSEWRQ